MAQPFNLSHEKMPLAVELREATAANIALRKRIAKHDAAAEKDGSHSAPGKLSFGLGFAESVAHIPAAEHGGTQHGTGRTTGHTATDAAKFL